MRRRVESPSIRNNVSLSLDIPRAHQLGKPIENSMAIGASLVILCGLQPICAPNTLESVMNEGDARAAGRGSERDHQPCRMQPTASFFQPGQNQAFLWLQFQDGAADPGFAVGTEKAISATD